MNIKNSNVCFLGDANSLQAENLKRIFSGHGREIHVFDYFSNPTTGQRVGTGAYLSRFYEKLYGMPERRRKSLLEYLDARNIGTVIASWGTNPLPYVISIKRERPRITVISDVLCHPTGLTPLKVHIQNTYYRYASKFIDGFIFSSQVMVDYFSKYVSRIQLPFVIAPQVFAKDYAPITRIPDVAEFPNVIFLGRMDWWDGQSCDNVHRELSDIMEQKVFVYHSDKTGTLPFHPYRRIFSPMPLASLISFATQYDASLVTYNLDACKKHDRFNTTIPDRLIASVAAGIPVAIPSTGYDASREFLRPYEAVIEYKSTRDLCEHLSDRLHIKTLKAMAIKFASWYSADAYIQKVFDLIARVNE